jgi:predicted O-methyltransferase YrrM
MTANPLRQMFMMGSIWFLARTKRNQSLNIVEIGSWTGASALTWGEALFVHNSGKGTLNCVDAWKPYYTKNENYDSLSKGINDALASDEPYKVFKENIKFLPATVKLKVYRGWSADVLPKLEQAGSDLVYIDGDHSYKGVLSDIEHSSGLVKDGGIICGDDLERQSHQVDATIAKERPHLDKMFDKTSNSIFHPGVTLAVGEIFGPVSSWYGFWAMQKLNNEWKKVSLDGMPPHIPSFLSLKNLIGLKALLMEKGYL